MSDQLSWFYAWENRPRGPIDQAGLQVLAAQGFLTEQTWVWRDSWPHWQTLSATELGAGLVFGSRIPSPVTLPPLPSLPSLPVLLPPPLPLEPPARGQLRQFGFNLLVLCGAFAALVVSMVPLFSSLSLSFSGPITALALVSVLWAVQRRTPRKLPLLSVLAALCAVAIGARNYRTENQYKPSLTELLAIHDRGTPVP